VGGIGSTAATSRLASFAVTAFANSRVPIFPPRFAVRVAGSFSRQSHGGVDLFCCGGQRASCPRRAGNPFEQRRLREAEARAGESAPRRLSRAACAMLLDGLPPRRRQERVGRRSKKDRPRPWICDAEGSCKRAPPISAGKSEPGIRGGGDGELASLESPQCLSYATHPASEGVAMTRFYFHHRRSGVCPALRHRDR